MNNFHSEENTKFFFFWFCYINIFVIFLGKILGLLGGFCWVLFLSLFLSKFVGPLLRWMGLKFIKNKLFLGPNI